MEFIVFTSSAGINTNDLLEFIKVDNHEAVLISFDSLFMNSNTIESDFVKKTIDASIAHAEVNNLSKLPLRIVVHGTYTDELVRLIFSNYNNVKCIFIFDTPDTAVAQHLSNSGLYESVDVCLKSWERTIARSVTFAEEHSATCALIDFKTVLHTPQEVETLLNKKLDIELGKCKLESQNYSSITRLIAASTLLSRDDLMVWYDDAKNLALALDTEYQYTEVFSLLEAYSVKACSELQALFENAKLDNSREHSTNLLDILSLKKSHLHELELSLLQIKQLQKEVEVLSNERQSLIHKAELLEITLLASKQQQEELDNLYSQQQQMKNDLSVFAATQQKLANTENELKIAFLQINLLQEEIEELFDKYQTFEHESGDSNLAKKMVQDNPFAQLLRQYSLSTNVN
jgi:hypothetical protein